MARAQFVDEVQLVLTVVAPPSSLAEQPLNARYLLLTKENPTIEVGRTSKRDANLNSSRTNAWIDSAVMSRHHAVFEFDVDSKTIFIKDVGSLHGTFLNGVRLAKDHPQPLRQGDELRFGVSVERNTQAFSPCRMRAHFIYGTETRPENRPVVFRVPDDTDVEDDDDFSIGNSSVLIRSNGFRPAQLLHPAQPAAQQVHPAQPVDGSQAIMAAIDLTADDKEPDPGTFTVIEGRRPHIEDWESCSSLPSPKTPADLDSQEMTSTVPTSGALEEGPIRIDDDVIDDKGAAGNDDLVDAEDSTDAQEVDDESLVLEGGSLGFCLAAANFPPGLASLGGCRDEVGLDEPRSMVQQYDIGPDNSVTLDSPPVQCLAAKPLRASSPVLDETSAFMFEQSKKAADGAAPLKEAHVGDHKEAEVPPNDQSSRKRKAEKISDLTPEERNEEASAVREPFICSSHASLQRALADQAQASRATKRIRRAAEVFGYAAIGGLAVMSALIATAPAL